MTDAECTLRFLLSERMANPLDAEALEQVSSRAEQIRALMTRVPDGGHRVA